MYYDENYIPKKRKNSRRDIKEYQPKSGTAVAYNYAVKKKKEIINVFCWWSALGNITLRNNDKGIAYQMLLNMFYMNDIEPCNRLLKSMGLSPLTKEEY